MNQTSDNIPVAIEQKPVNHVTLNVYPSQELLNRDNDIVIVNQELEIKSSIYNRSRVVYVLTIIDIVFLIINLIVSIVVKNLFWLFFILCPLCYLGNKGACEYKKDYVSENHVGAGGGNLLLLSEAACCSISVGGMMSISRSN